MRELWMRGRKFLPFGHSDQYIADQLKVELSEWLECRHICSGPPLQLNETVHRPELPQLSRQAPHRRRRPHRGLPRRRPPGMEQRTQDRSEAVLGLPRVGGYEARVEALEAVIQAACDVLDGHGLPAGDEEDMPLRAATYGGPEDEVSLHFEDEELGNGRINLACLTFCSCSNPDRLKCPSSTGPWLCSRSRLTT